MGKKRGYKLGDNPGELQKAIDQIVEVQKGKEKRETDLEAERQASRSANPKRLLAAVLVGVMAISMIYAGLQMGWIRWGQPSALSEALQDPAKATTLKLDGQRLGQVPQEIGTLSKLEVLVLDSNGLQEVPPDLGRLTELQTLSLNYNKLSDLPTQLGSLSRLRQLGLKANRFQGVPKAIDSLTELRELDLSNNGMVELPEEIGKLRKLEILRLRGNSITKLPSGLANLHELKELDLAQNPVSALPSPNNFPKLRRLSVRQTKVDDASIASYQKTIPKVSLLR